MVERLFPMHVLGVLGGSVQTNVAQKSETMKDAPKLGVVQQEQHRAPKFLLAPRVGLLNG